MNIVLLDAEQTAQPTWCIQQPRQVQHLKQHLNLQPGESLKVGIRGAERYLCKVLEITDAQIIVEPIALQSVPAKLPVCLVVAMPRPKVLRRLIMDSVTLGVEKICLIHSYRVDKSYWQSPFLKQLDDYVTLGLEQAGDTIAPEIEIHKRFKPFVEDVLATRVSLSNPAWVAHPYTEQRMPQAIKHACTVVVGPEGGFIPYEVELFQANGCQVFTLGDRILRTETAISTVLGRLYG